MSWRFTCLTRKRTRPRGPGPGQSEVPCRGSRRLRFLVGDGTIRLPNSVAVAHRLGGHLEVLEEGVARRGGRIRRLDRRPHVHKPPVARLGADPERRVAHAEPWMAAFLVIGERPAPV